MPKSRARSLTPADRVLTQLRYGPGTVEELSRSLRLTDNAVRNQLRKLIDVGLVAASGTRPGVSKPSVLYSITLEGQIRFSTLYLPVLSHFLRMAEEKCSHEQLGQLMSETGKSLAMKYPNQRGSIEDRAQSGARLLTALGGLAEVKKKNGTTVIRSRICPLAALTSENPAVCQVIEGLLAEYMSADAETCCGRDEHPHCCFMISNASLTERSTA